MNAHLTHAMSGATIKEITQPIRWLFNHDREVVSFIVKALDTGEGYLLAKLDNNTEFAMFWSSYHVMMDSLLKSRAWRNHFSGININKACYSSDLGWHTKTWTIG